MKLRNKKTGEIKRVEFLNDYQTDDGAEIGFRVADTLDVYSYNSLDELNEEWEDVIEFSKEYYVINIYGDVLECKDRVDSDLAKEMKKDLVSIGNDFKTREEAEKAVEKLKAWKRLQDKGVKLEIVTIGHRKYLEPTAEDDKTFDEVEELIKDFELIFGGEE